MRSASRLLTALGLLLIVTGSVIVVAMGAELLQRERPRPLAGGVQITIYDDKKNPTLLCTIGYSSILELPDGRKEVGVVTAAHCYEGLTLAKLYDNKTYQPRRCLLDRILELLRLRGPNYIGKPCRFIEIVDEGRVRLTDAAFICTKRDTGVDAAGKIARVDIVRGRLKVVYDTVVGYYTLDEIWKEIKEKRGMRVYKSGRTTGTTFGDVINVEDRCVMSYRGLIYCARWVLVEFPNPDEGAAMGDSGGPVARIVGTNKVKLVGIISWGGMCEERPDGISYCKRAYLVPADYLVTHAFGVRVLPITGER